MKETVLLARGRELIELPREQWETHLSQAPAHAKARLGFMTADHHRVRYCVVRELPAHGRPMAPGFIGRTLQMPVAQVQRILDELERNLLFLVRDDKGRVTWAFPGTVEPTPHRLRFSSGEALYAA